MKAKITMGEFTYEGRLILSSVCNRHCWEFHPKLNTVTPFNCLFGKYTESEEAALEDGKAHGITVEE